MKQFHHFNGGYQVEDSLINAWIREALDRVQTGQRFTCMSTGDTSVIAFDWDTEIQVIVANDAGRSTLCFSKYPGEEDNVNDFTPYVRPNVEAKYTSVETFERWVAGTPLEGTDGTRYLKISQDVSHHTDGYVVRQSDGALLHYSECGLLKVSNGR